MDNKEFDEYVFRCGDKVKSRASGTVFVLASCDFKDRTIGVVGLDGEIVYSPCSEWEFHIEKKKAKHSERDSRGHLNVACCECNRGGNGDASCGSGGRHKKWNYMACFSGELLESLEE